jgi:mRNA-degrading endonuclease RelE of RelBE toxin-antitoxin system
MLSSALGTPHRRRLRVGRYRVYFGVEDLVVRVVRIARSPER